MREADILQAIGISFPQSASAPLGIGDDAAAIRPRAGQYLLLTTDSLVEGIHFDLAFCNYFQLGQRAIAVNVSDIAAMGGTPTALLVSLGLTERQRHKEIAALYRGMKKEAGPVALVGGNISASPTFWLSITLVGEVAPKKMVKRAGACAGDTLYVTGTLGDAAAGLAILKSGRGDLRNERRYRPLITRYRTPHARQREGACLAAEGLVSAMIDLSDGLSTDVGHLAEQSGVGMEIDAAQIPISPALRRYVQRVGRDPIDFALNGGDDYELLFAVPPKKQSRLSDLIQRGIINATPIGVVVSKSRGRRIYIDGQIRPLVAAGYDHCLGNADTPPARKIDGHRAKVPV